MLQGNHSGCVGDDHGTCKRHVAAVAADRRITIRLGHKSDDATRCIAPEAGCQATAGAGIAEVARCRAQAPPRSVPQPRKIHQVQPTTRIRLPMRAEMTLKWAMLCFPKCWWQAERSAIRCGWRQPGGWRSTGLPRHARSLRTARIAWQFPIQTGFRRSSSPRARGVLFLGPKPGGIHRRSWLQAVVAGY